jgi:glycosyltransferase involved in cell wall biosynthesis
MDISVAICTWNRCDILQQMLERLCAIPVPARLRWEVLVVNNNCSDRTDAVAGAFHNRLPLRRLFEAQPGASHARNLALDEARGDYIAWVDDDVLVADDWLIALADAIERRPLVEVFGGPIEPWFPAPPDPVLLAAFPALANGFCGLDYGDEEMPLPDRRPLFTSNMAIARRAIEGLRFNPALGGTAGSGVCGEDVEFLNAIRARGGAVLWVPRMRVKHYVDPARTTLTYLSRFYYDRGRSVVRQRACGDVPRLLGAPRWCWRAMVEHYARYAALRITQRRTQALANLRQYHYARGVIAESFAQRRATA